MREKIESKPVPNPLDKPSWERVGRAIGSEEPEDKISRTKGPNEKACRYSVSE